MVRNVFTTWTSRGSCTNGLALSVELEDSSVGSIMKQEVGLGQRAALFHGFISPPFSGRVEVFPRRIGFYDENGSKWESIEP